MTTNNHRNHHDQTKIIRDSNYGGIFCIWDRIFGTYTESIAIKDFKSGFKNYNEQNIFRIQVDPLISYFKNLTSKLVRPS